MAYKQNVLPYNEGGTSQSVSADIGSSLIFSSSNPVWSKNATSDVLVIEDDFLYVKSGAAIDWPWKPGKNGTSSVCEITASTAANPGIFRLDTGTDSNGESSIVKGKADGGGNGNFILGGGVFDITFVCNIATLATGVEDYVINFGLGDGLEPFVSHPGNNAVIFQYNRATSTNWLGLTISSGSSTTASGGSNVAVATGFQKFRISINAAASSISFYVGNVLIGTSTANIPSVVISLGACIKKSAGTTARTFDVDYIRLVNILTTSRFA